MPVNNLIQVRRGTLTQWSTANPTLSVGEIGFESDTGKFKVGNGSTNWAGLAYAASQPGHTHVKTDITDFAHTHVKADITDFAHTHVKADITDFAHTHGMGDLTGFAITDPLNGQTLTYDQTSGKWINSVAASGGGFSTSFLLMGA
jgi:hypothetical protein